MYRAVAIGFVKYADLPLSTRFFGASAAALFRILHVHCRNYTNSQNTKFFPHTSVLRIYIFFPTQREFVRIHNLPIMVLPRLDGCLLLLVTD